MSAVIPITPTLSIEPLVTITDPEFAKQYSMGVWWALYGDEQGQGKYDDRYLTDNIQLLVNRSFAAAHVGFYLGMIHGGWLVAQQQALVSREALSTF